MRLGLIVSAVMAMVDGLALPVAGAPVRAVRRAEPAKQDRQDRMAIEAAEAKRARKAAARAQHGKD